MVLLKLTVLRLCLVENSVRWVVDSVLLVVLWLVWVWVWLVVRSFELIFRSCVVVLVTLGVLRLVWTCVVSLVVRLCSWL